MIKILHLLTFLSVYLECISSGSRCSQSDYKSCGEANLEKCVPKEWWCDGHQDCDSGNDELNCVASGCHKHEIACKSGTQCIPKFLLCDGMSQCLDGSDEHNCSNSQSKSCDPRFQFDCLNDGQHCVPLSVVCDGRNDCGSNQDEIPGGSKDNCQKNDCRLTANGGCSHICTNLFTKSFCHCKDGFRLLEDSKTCVDIDECSIYPSKCSQVCNNTIGSYECMCHEGYTLDGKESGDCIAAEGDRSILVTLENDKIFTLNLLTSSTSTQNINSSSWDITDVHIAGSTEINIFWSRFKDNSIGKTTIRSISNGSTVFEIVSTKSIYKMNAGTFSAGLSFDWLRSLLFWTNMDEGRLYVTNTTSNKTAVIETKGLENPRSIVADPFESRLYWIDWGTKSSSARIETMLMNGVDQRILVQQGLRQPQAITIDFLDHRLYWNDINPGSVTFIDLNRPLIKKTVISNKLFHPFSIAIFENKIFWTDWRQNQIFSAGKSFGDNIRLVGQVSRPMSISILNPLVRPGLSANESRFYTCIKTSFIPCSDICVPWAPSRLRYYSTFKCLCPIGTDLSPDSHSCGFSKGNSSLILPKNMNRFTIIASVMLSLIGIFVISMTIILIYLGREKICVRSYKGISQRGVRHPIVTGDLMFIFKCHSHSSQLSDLLNSDLNSVSNA